MEMNKDDDTCIPYILETLSNRLTIEKLEFLFFSDGQS